MMRYLEYDFLKDKGLQHFDNWVTVFGTQKTDWELAPAGNKFKERTRIAQYTGLPVIKHCLFIFIQHYMLNTISISESSET